MKFTVGEAVQWTSQSGGYTKVKRGKIAAVVPGMAPGDRTHYLNHFIPKDLENTAGHPGPSVHFDGFQRNHECYIVFVPSDTGKGRGHLYCPAVVNLRSPTRKG